MLGVLGYCKLGAECKVSLIVYGSTEMPTGSGVSLVVAGTQVSSPTKRPDLLKCTSYQANAK